MKDWAESFYKSRAWQNCAKAYAKSKGGLCERCLKEGRYSAGVIVHHKIHLTPDNVFDHAVTLNFDNLELVCRDCHAAEHGNKKRYKVDDLGFVYTPHSENKIVNPPTHASLCFAHM